jgi:hypothetical protein
MPEMFEVYLDVYDTFWPINLVELFAVEISTLKDTSHDYYSLCCDREAACESLKSRMPHNPCDSPIRSSPPWPRKSKHTSADTS